MPEGMKPGPIGTYLTNESGTTTVVIIAGPAKFSLENDRTYRTLFSDPPETMPGLGNLYRRTRAQHGGGWDGWWLSAIRGETVLNVQVSYTGTDPDEFESLKKLFSSIQWREGPSDPELAFGLTTSISDLHVVHDGFGALSFTVDGKAGTRGRSLLLQAMPVPRGTGELVVPGACASGFAASFQGQSYTGPNEIEEKGIVVCDAWSNEGSGNARYMALLLMPSGAVVSVSGSGDPLQMRSAALNLRATR
jgi:hypothetical protein